METPMSPQSHRPAKLMRSQWDAFIANQRGLEPMNMVFTWVYYFIPSVLYVYLFVYELHSVLTWKQGVAWWLFIIIAENLYYGMGHVGLHAHMYCGYLYGKLDVIPYGSFHHYFDNRLYSYVPYTWRMSMAWLIVHVISMSVGLGFGINPLLTYSFTLLFFVDAYSHEWYHTPKYRSWNPFSATFVGINWCFKFLEVLGFVDNQAHKHHHAHSIRNQEDCEDWLDFGFPGTSKLVEQYCHLIYAFTTRVTDKMFDSFCEYPIVKFVLNVIFFGLNIGLLLVVWQFQLAYFPELETLDVVDIRGYNLAICLLCMHLNTIWYYTEELEPLPRSQLTRGRSNVSKKPIHYTIYNSLYDDTDDEQS